MAADVAIPLPLHLPLFLTVAIPLPIPLPLSLTVAIRLPLVIKALKESEQDRKKITANKVGTEEMEAEVAIRVLCRLGFWAEIRITIDLFSSYSTITEEGNRFSDTINWFIGIKGFGLIIPKDGGEDLLVHQSIRSGGYRSLAEEDSVDSKGDNGRTNIVDLSGPNDASIQGGARGAGGLRGFRRSGGRGSDVRDRRYLGGSGYGYGSGGGSDGRYFGGSGGDYEVCGYHKDGRRSFSPESFKLETYSVNEE